MLAKELIKKCSIIRLATKTLRLLKKWKDSNVFLTAKSYAEKE